MLFKMHALTHTRQKHNASGYTTLWSFMAAVMWINSKPDVSEMFSTLGRFLLALRLLLSPIFLNSVHSRKSIDTTAIITRN